MGGGMTTEGWLWLAAALLLLLAPPLMFSAILKKFGRSRLWALIWFVLLAAWYAWFVWSYDR
jgi:hypothetical protein